MHVLEHEQHGRPLGGQARQQVEHELAQPRLSVSVTGIGAGPDAREHRGERAVQLLVEPREVPAQPVLGDASQRGGERRIRQLLAAEDALAAQHEHVERGRALLEGRGEPRLADARLAGEQQ